jgi:ER-bound oxygenase mpaB/B'/Rubber oxygenase, catalytic domain
VAKKFVEKLFLEAINEPCTVDQNDLFPSWYDDHKFKRAQRYFKENRFGIVVTSLVGLLSLFAEPHELAVLTSTGRLSEAKTSKSRVIRTTLHMLTWYETELATSSLSWASLRKVRRLHFCTSNSSERKGIGHISELDLALTTFGFMGFAIIRPHLFGIEHKSEDDHEAFIHFWAAVGHALGVQDKNNMCLFSPEVVGQICEIFRRYIFIPLMQVETPMFKSIVAALVAGYSDYMPLLNYNSLVLDVKKFNRIPGYQFNSKWRARETVCRPIFTSIELATIRQVISQKPSFLYTHEICFTEQIPVITVQERLHKSERLEHLLEKHMELDDDQMVTIRYSAAEHRTDAMNDNKWKELTPTDQVTAWIRDKIFEHQGNPFVRFVFELFLTTALFFMKRQLK